MLGADLLVVQREQKRSADTNARLLAEAFQDHSPIADVETFVGTGVWGSDGYDGDGGLDPRKLDTTLTEIHSVVGNHSDGIAVALKYLSSSVREQADASKKSLRLTWVGLSLIIIGFGLQVLAALSQVNWE
jgi:hypothetical protein